MEMIIINEVTININNFDLIEYMNSLILNGESGYITKAKDRDDNDGILLFIPTGDIMIQNKIMDYLKL